MEDEDFRLRHSFASDVGQPRNTLPMCAHFLHVQRLSLSCSLCRWGGSSRCRRRSPPDVGDLISERLGHPLSIWELAFSADRGLGRGCLLRGFWENERNTHAGITHSAASHTCL